MASSLQYSALETIESSKEYSNYYEHQRMITDDTVNTDGVYTEFEDEQVLLGMNVNTIGVGTGNVALPSGVTSPLQTEEALDNEVSISEDIVMPTPMSPVDSEVGKTIDTLSQIVKQFYANEQNGGHGLHPLQHSGVSQLNEGFNDMPQGLPSLISPQSKDLFSDEQIEQMEDEMSKEMEIMRDTNWSTLFRKESSGKWDDEEIDEQSKEMAAQLMHLIQRNSKNNL